MKIINAEFVTAIEEYQAEMARLEERPQMSEYLGEVFETIAGTAQHKTNFKHPAHSADMVMDGVLKCLECIGNFDSSKSQNPHAYFTRICINEYGKTVQDNSKQNAIISEVMEFEGVATKSSRNSLINYLEHNPRTVFKTGREASAAKKLYNWVNKDGRTFVGIPTELRNEFPKEKLSQGMLSTIARGERPHHKGWSIEN